jgi:hypothetical protein
LAIEALLELFAKLLPSTRGKNGLEKRNAFIKEVFDPTVFTCSGEIVHFLTTVSTNDWEETFLRILDILGRADITLWVPNYIPLHRH